MSRFGPSRGEHVLRLVLSLAGLALLVVALLRHGVAGLASAELLLLGGGFLGGSALWSAWRLWRGGRGR